MSADDTRDHVAGLQWAQRQEDRFADWAAACEPIVTEQWNFSVDSLDLLTYLVMHRYPTLSELRDPANESFYDGTCWYLGEVIRRADPKRRRWVLLPDEPPGERMVVEYTGANRGGPGDTRPGRLLRVLLARGDPCRLRHYGINVVNPVWRHSWPSWPFSSEVGPFRWDDRDAGWHSRRDDWRAWIPALIDALAARLPGVALDFSAESLSAVEVFAVTALDPQDEVVRSAVVAYLGECLLTVGGGTWIWDGHPANVTTGCPVLVSALHSGSARVSPVHILEYARAWRDGVTFTRVYRAWVNAAAELRTAGHADRLVRDGRRTIEGAFGTRPAVQRWVDQRRSAFGQWLARYGGDHRWDFTPDSLDGLQQVLVDTCPDDEPLAGLGDEFCDGAVWYFGEVLRRARPSYWQCRAMRDDYGLPGAGPAGRLLPNMRIVCPDITYSKPSEIDLLHELDLCVRPSTGPRAPWGWQINPDHPPYRLREVHYRWAGGQLPWRIDESFKRRCRAQRRRWPKLDDAGYLQRWLGERSAGLTSWVRTLAVAPGELDFSLASLDIVESRLVDLVATPEEFLEDTQNRELVDGAVWYLGETMLRQWSGDGHWTYSRAGGGELGLAGPRAPWPVAVLAEMYVDVQRRGGVLRRAAERALVDVRPDG